MSRAWYLTALVPLAIGITIAVVSFSRLIDNVESMQRLVAPGERTFVLNAGEYVVFGESESTVDGTVYRNDSFAVNCALTTEGGTQIPLSRPTGKTRYALGGYSGTGLFEFALPSAQTVKLACTSEDGKVVLAIGGGIGAAIVVAVVCGLFGLFSAGGVFLLVFLKRRKFLARQRAKAAG